MSSEDYKVLPLLKDPDEYDYIDVGENLLKPPFCMGIVGSRFVGKTNLLMTLMMRKFPYYLGCFSRIILISACLKFDSSTKALCSYIGDENCFEEYDDGIISALMEHQKQMPKHMRESLCIILDDIPALNLPQNSLAYKISSYARHFNCSLIYINQVLRAGQNSLPPLVRNNLEGLCVFRNSNSKQIQNICEELGHFGSPHNIEAMYNSVVSGKPYQFLFLNSRNLKCYRNFEEEIWSMYDEDGNYNEEFVKQKKNKIKNNVLENEQSSSTSIQ